MQRNKQNFHNSEEDKVEVILYLHWRTLQITSFTLNIKRASINRDNITVINKQFAEFVFNF